MNKIKYKGTNVSFKNTNTRPKKPKAAYDKHNDKAKVKYWDSESLFWIIKNGVINKKVRIKLIISVN